MDPLFFGFKRAHLRALAGTWRRLRKCRVNLSGITPARFDMMRVIAARGDGLPQRNLVELLGVSAQTVSRMLDSLERLHIVERTPMARDKRCLWVRLTSLYGEGLLFITSSFLLDTGDAQRMALRGFANDDAPESAYPNLRDFRRRLCKIRRASGDRTPYEEPWRPGPNQFFPWVVDDAVA